MNMRGAGRLTPLDLGVCMAWALVLVAGWSTGAHAQDVEKLGRQYGTTPPAGYFEQIAQDPGAFQFQVEGQMRLEQLQMAAARRFSGHVLLRMDGAARSIGPRSQPLVGTFRFPVILGTFSDTSTPLVFGPSEAQQAFFDGPNSLGQTLPEFFAEMSRGLLQLEGQTTPWMASGLTASQVTLGNSGLVSSRTSGVGAYIEALVQALDAQGMDWSPYDQTGDGYVDLLAVIHPTRGGECGGDGSSGRIWSHRWNIASATSQRLSNGIPTQTPGPGPGGVIHIMDYTIQPLLSCLSTETHPRINEIGVFAHELGHGFGLPDLYGTGSSRHTGVGGWDLMATGAWGCQPGTPASPCPMGAWSRAMLGWADVVDLSPDTDYGTLTLPPSLSTGRIFRVPAQDGSGSYLLLENRQATGLDAGVFEPGLLIWQVDAPLVASRWPSNTVNSLSNRMGVRIRTASGRRNLELAGGDAGGGSHGTPGDIHPGCIKESSAQYFDPSIPCAVQTAFHMATPSQAVGPFGVPLVVTIQEIAPSGSDMTFRISTRWTRLALEAQEGDVSVPGASFQVNGETFPSGGAPFLGAPFQSVSVSAPSGGEIAPGIRLGFQGWQDGGDERTRPVLLGTADTLMVANLGGREVRLEWEPEVIGDVPFEATLVPPGSLIADPPPVEGGWVVADQPVTLEARARPGFRFVDWVGALAGASNPVIRSFEEPAQLGARFEVSFAFLPANESREVPGAAPFEWLLPVTEATPPIVWQVVEGELPSGVTLDATAGVLGGIPVSVGVYPLKLEAIDATGLSAQTDRELRIALPALTETELVGFWLGTGPAPLGPVRTLLDELGNGNGFYDLGDLRAYLLKREGH